MRLRLLGLLVLLVCLWQGEAQFRAGNALKTAAGANQAPKTLPNLAFGQRKEFGRHSQKKRAIIQSFVENYLFKPAAAGGLRSKGATGDNWLYAEGFSGPGFHYNDPVTSFATGSAIAVVESAVQNAFIPRFWFNDFDHDTIGHLEATVKVAATAATAANKIAADAEVNDRVIYSEGKFEAKFPAKVAASRDLNIYAHIDPFFYHTAPWAAVTSMFTDNPNGKIRAASINLFTGLMVGDLTKALTQNPPRGPIRPTDAVAKIAAAFGYAPAANNGHATQFLNALSTKFYNIYHPARNLAAGPAQTWGAGEIVTHLQAVALHANQFKRANAVSRALAELYADRLQTVTTHHLKSAAHVAVARTKVALIPTGSPYIMYWLLFASNANTYNTKMNAVYQAQATQTSKHGAKYFTAQNKPANVARTQGDTDQFISIAEKVRFRTRRSDRITFGDALEKLLANKPKDMTR